MFKHKHPFGGVSLLFWRLAASGWLPGRWFVRGLPAESERAARRGELSVEVVSHCWNYAHLLAYQLSSLVLHPPRKTRVTMTVFYAPEDERTVKLLEFFRGQEVANVRWNFRPLAKEQMFRRSIGRNLAALATEADWIWFTDCDLVFYEGCLDGLCERLQGRRDALVFPLAEACSEVLPEDARLLREGRTEPRLLDIDPADFRPQTITRATGPLQITHGDVARACGYCRDIGYYQRPAAKWCKAHEDRAFRWLIGSQGVGLDIPGVYRIRHLYKGRYNRSRLETVIRTRIRQLKSSLERRG